VEAFDHGPLLAARKFDQPARIGTGDSKRIDHALFIETQQPPGGDRAAKRSRQCRRVKASPLKRVSRSHADARKNLACRNECRQQRFTVGLILFRHCKGGDESCSARMHA
jgi:hypothetical protein